MTSVSLATATVAEARGGAVHVPAHVRRGRCRPRIKLAQSPKYRRRETHSLPSGLGVPRRVGARWEFGHGTCLGFGPQP